MRATQEGLLYDDDDDTFDEADFYGSSAPTEELVDTDAPIADEAGHGEEATEEGGEQSSAPEPKYLDLSQFSDHVIRVKVDGEEIEVPVTDLPGGYSRTQDYTRKTQALAAEREEVAFWKQVDQAMRANPQMTLDYLSKTYGVEVANQAAANVEDDDDDWGVDPGVKALKAEIAELRQALSPVVQATSRQQAEQFLKSTVDGLTQKYGDDFNPTEVIQEAINRGIQDPNLLEAVYRDMKFDQYRAQAAAVQTLSASKAETEAQRKAAAAQAAAVTGAGSSSRGAAPTAPKPQYSGPAGRMTPRDAFRLAMAELNNQ